MANPDAAIVPGTEELVPLEPLLTRMAAFEPTPFPVISLYLDVGGDHRGQGDSTIFAKSKLKDLAATYAEGSDERKAFDADAERILEFLDADREGGGETLIVFACSGENLFETVLLDAPLERSEGYVNSQPHLFTLAWLQERYARCAIVVADTNRARIFVTSLGKLTEERVIGNKKVGKSKPGGWSQRRYQRRAENAWDEHAEEVVEKLKEIVERDAIGHLILAGDELIVPRLREAMPGELQELIDTDLRLDIESSEEEILDTALEALSEADLDSDEKRVTELVNEYRAGGLAALGPVAVLVELLLGHAEEVLLTAPIEDLDIPEEAARRLVEQLGRNVEDLENPERRGAAIADSIVACAEKTGARLRFIEEAALLEKFRGAGAFLRYKL